MRNRTRPFLPGGRARQSSAAGAETSALERSAWRAGAPTSDARNLGVGMGHEQEAQGGPDRRGLPSPVPRPIVTLVGWRRAVGSAQVRPTPIPPDLDEAALLALAELVEHSLLIPLHDR